MPTLICDCNRTMPLDVRALGLAVGETLTPHSALCRREAGDYQRAVKSGDEVLVACTQEKRTFAALANDTEGAVSPIRFVNIRETGGWSRDAQAATPKLAALLAAARLPEPEPVTTVTYKSTGRLLVIGPLDAAERAAEMLEDVLNVTVFADGPGVTGGGQERRWPVLSGRAASLTGWLGAFRFGWLRDNPIDLDLCTRCNACVTACPESAIGLDYQVDMSRCTNHRDCVAACTVAGAINFNRAPAEETEDFDLVLDLRAAPAFAQHAKPQGYFQWDGQSLPTLLKLRDMVGEFEKPKFFDYRQSLCAHSRNGKVGCDACVTICSALAIRSDVKHQRIEVNPNLCVGCGACTTACPTGALGYSYPRAAEQGTVFRTLLSAYARAGGRDGALLLHSQEAGRALVENLGRAARLGTAHGVPANVIPVAVWHTASIGIDLWLSAVAYGATQVAVLVTGEEAPQYLDGLEAQMQIAQTILTGLGYAGAHLHLVHAASPESLDAQLQVLKAARPQGPAQPARYAVVREKRATLDFAIEHLIAHAPAPTIEAIPLPAGVPGAGAPFGTLEIDKNACTLCLSCVSACPASALKDNPERPQLSFIERNCVQCGLCATTCPEDAITLVPRLLASPARKETRVLNEVAPYSCVRCSKPFGTVKAIEAMLGKLSGHPMFQGAALERLKMCGDCRVIDMYTAQNEVKITQL
jgi:ferredoxin